MPDSCAPAAHDPSQGPPPRDGGLARRGGTPCLTRQETWLAALRGVDRAYLLASPHALASFLDAVREPGLWHAVLVCSSIVAVERPNATDQVQAALRADGHPLKAGIDLPGSDRLRGQQPALGSRDLGADTRPTGKPSHGTRDDLPCRSPQRVRRPPRKCRPPGPAHGRSVALWADRASGCAHADACDACTAPRLAHCPQGRQLRYPGLTLALLGSPRSGSHRFASRPCALMDGVRAGGTGRQRRTTRRTGTRRPGEVPPAKARAHMVGAVPPPAVERVGGDAGPPARPDGRWPKHSRSGCGTPAIRCLDPPACAVSAWGGALPVWGHPARGAPPVEPG